MNHRTPSPPLSADPAPRNALPERFNDILLTSFGALAQDWLNRRSERMLTASAKPALHYEAPAKRVATERQPPAN
jgi:hypothetical protein